METVQSIAKWADETFGQADNMTIGARANQEMAELLRALAKGDSPQACLMEIADVFIVLARLIKQLGCESDHEFNLLLAAKMAINRGRKWTLTGDGHGYHVREKS